MAIKVLKANAAGSDAYAQVDLSSLATGAWYYQADFMIPSSTFTAIASSAFSADFLNIGLGETVQDGTFITGWGTDGSHHPFSFGNKNYWTVNDSGNPVNGSFTPDAWHTVKAHYNGSNTITWFFDGVSLISYSATFSGFGATVGAQAAVHASGEVYYIDNVKVGTTDGGSDIFCDDFESGNFSKWDATAGSVSIVDDPLGTGGPSGGCSPPPSPPVAAFTYTPPSGPAPLTVSFTDTSTPGGSGPITAWAWDFGDGHTSTAQNPTHTFMGVETFTVTLTVTGTSPDGTSMVSHDVSVTVGGAAYIYIAFGYNTYDTNAIFTPIEVQGYKIDRGRQYEMDKTQAGTASVQILDLNGDYDPTNPDSLYGSQVGPLLQAYITMVDPVDQSTHIPFTGFTESWTYAPDITGKWMVLTLALSDGFELLNRAEVVPDSSGTAIYAPQLVHDRMLAALADYNTGTPTAPHWQATHAYSEGDIVQPVVSTGSVFQAIQSGTSGGSEPTWPTKYGEDHAVTDGGVQWVLGPPGASWPAAWTHINSGNVIMKKTVYNPQTTLLSVLQDAADAEFPNVANVYMDKWGRVNFSGRWPRFTPEYFGTRIDNQNPYPPFQRIAVWHLGDRGAVDTFGYVGINSLEWILDLKNIINACLCTPYGLAQDKYEEQLRTNSSSIDKYGPRVLSIPDLLIETSVAGPAGPVPGGDGVGAPQSDPVTLNGTVECQIFAKYYVDNYSTTVPMISQIGFVSVGLDEANSAQHWAFLTSVEIGDLIVLTTTDVGGGGFKYAQFFVEGIHYVVNPLDGGLLDVNLSLDLSPRDWYQTFSQRNGDHLVSYRYYTPGGGSDNPFGNDQPQFPNPDPQPVGPVSSFTHTP